jgi:predicted membrane protein
MFMWNHLVNVVPAVHAGKIWYVKVAIGVHGCVKVAIGVVDCYNLNCPMCIRQD